MTILTLLSLPIHKHKMFFYLFSSFLSKMFCIFQHTGFAPSWLYLFLSIINAIINGIILLISLLHCSLLIYWNAIGFVYWSYILKLYWIYLLALVVFSFCDCLEFFIHKIMSFTKRENFTSSFPICVPSFSVPSIALARTFSIILNRSVESRHPCYVPDFRGKAFHLSQVSIMWLRCFIVVVFF